MALLAVGFFGLDEVAEVLESVMALTLILALALALALHTLTLTPTLTLALHTLTLRIQTPSLPQIYD